MLISILACSLGFHAITLNGASYVGRYIVFLANQDHVLALRVTCTASTVLGDGQNLVEVSHAH